MRRAINERNILFLCQDNAQLSQMAEAAAKHLAPPKTRIFSAGIHPGRIPPSVIAAMHEIGIPMAGQKSKGVSDVPVDEIDLVVSFGDAHKQCTSLPGRAKVESWPIAAEPKNQSTDSEELDKLRQERSDIQKRVFALFMDYWRNVI